MSLYITSRFSATFNFISIHFVHSIQFSEFRIKANYFKTAHLECAKHDIVLFYLAFKTETKLLIEGHTKTKFKYE